MWKGNNCAVKLTNRACSCNSSNTSNTSNSNNSNMNSSNTSSNNYNKSGHKQNRKTKGLAKRVNTFIATMGRCSLRLSVCVCVPSGSVKMNGNWLKNDNSSNKTNANNAKRTATIAPMRNYCRCSTSSSPFLYSEGGLWSTGKESEISVIRKAS